MVLASRQYLWHQLHLIGSVVCHRHSHHLRSLPLQVQKIYLPLLVPVEFQQDDLAIQPTIQYASIPELIHSEDLVFLTQFVWKPNPANLRLFRSDVVLSELTHGYDEDVLTIVVCCVEYLQGIDSNLHNLRQPR